MSTATQYQENTKDVTNEGFFYYAGRVVAAPIAYVIAPLVEGFADKVAKLIFD